MSDVCILAKCATKHDSYMAKFLFYVHTRSVSLDKNNVSHQIELWDFQHNIIN